MPYGIGQNGLNIRLERGQGLVLASKSWLWSKPVVVASPCTTTTGWERVASDKVDQSGGRGSALRTSELLPLVVCLKTARRSALSVLLEKTTA